MACMEESLFAGHILIRSEPVSLRQAYKGEKTGFEQDCTYLVNLK